MTLDDIARKYLDDARELSCLAYVKFLDTYNFFDQIKSPTAPERVYYELQWNDRAAKIVNLILKFLNQKNIVELEGEIIGIGPNLQKFREKYPEPFETYLEQNEISAFLKYGLRKLHEIIEGGLGEWDLENLVFRLESALVIPFLKTLQPKLMSELSKVESKFPSVCLVGVGAEMFVSMIEPYIEEPSQVWILEISPEGVDRALSFLDLENKTSHYSKQVAEASSLINNEFDFIFLNNFFHIFRDLDHWSKILNQMTNTGGRLVINTPTLDSMLLGLEPLYLLIDSVNRIPSTEEVKKFLKVSGFKHIINDPDMPTLFYIT